MKEESQYDFSLTFIIEGLSVSMARKKKHRDLEEEIKCYLFDNKVSTYIEYSKELQKKKIRSEFSKMAWYKINKPILTVFFCMHE